MLGLRDEGSRGIVDEHIERRLAPDLIHHALDGCTVADIAAQGRDLAAILFAHCGRSSLEPVEAAAANDEFGTKLEETTSHRRSQSRTATGHQNAFPFEQACFKHRLNPPSICLVVASKARRKAPPGDRLREAKSTLSLR